MWIEFWQFIGPILLAVISYLLGSWHERRKFTFEILHVKRADVIKEVYKKIVRTYSALESLVIPLQNAGEPPEEQKMISFKEEFNGLSKYYQERRLYFKEEIAVKIDGFWKKIWEIWNHYLYIEDLRRGGEPISAELGKVWEQFKDTIPSIKSEIEKEFRDLVGVK